MIGDKWHFFLSQPWKITQDSQRALKAQPFSLAQNARLLGQVYAEKIL